jgi:hypothetical protein
MIGEDFFEHVFRISVEILKEVLTGADFLHTFRFTLNFREKCMTLQNIGMEMGTLT